MLIGYSNLYHVHKPKLESTMQESKLPKPLSAPELKTDSKSYNVKENRSLQETPFTLQTSQLMPPLSVLITTTHEVWRKKNKRRELARINHIRNELEKASAQLLLLINIIKLPQLEQIRQLLQLREMLTLHDGEDYRISSQLLSENLSDLIPQGTHETRRLLIREFFILNNLQDLLNKAKRSTIGYLEFNIRQLKTFLQSQKKHMSWVDISTMIILGGYFLITQPIQNEKLFESINSIIGTALLYEGLKTLKSQFSMQQFLQKSINTADEVLNQIAGIKEILHEEFQRMITAIESIDRLIPEAVADTSSRTESSLLEAKSFTGRHRRLDESDPSSLNINQSSLFFHPHKEPRQQTRHTIIQAALEEFQSSTLC